MQTESRVWSDSGVEPAAGDEVYAGQERPIAEYDNWAMWAVTKDIDEMATVLGDLEVIDSVTKVTFDTEANRPASSQDGHVYFEVDTGSLYGFRSGSWTQFGGAAPDSIGTTELDLSIAPGWTGKHQFDGGIALDDGSLANPGLAFSSDVDTGVHRPAADTLQWVTGGDAEMELTSSGNLNLEGTLTESTTV